MKKKISRSIAESRKFTVDRHVSEHGRSRARIICPFCGERSWAYIWSMSHGKRCENEDCLAIFLSQGLAYLDYV
jgi:hypothetical protein